jgi:hypothetical protein
MQRLVTTTYLEMTNRDELRPARPSALPLQLVRVDIPCPELNRFLYTAVGARWWWYSRLSWDYARWHAYLDRPELETWVAYVSGTPAGYFELERQPDAAVELAYLACCHVSSARVWGAPCSPPPLPGLGRWEPSACGCIPAPWTILRLSRITKPAGFGSCGRRSR